MKSEKKTTKKNTQHNQRPVINKKPFSKKSLVVWNLVIIVISFLAFSPCLTGEFLGWDDCNYIRDNALIKLLSWENIMYIFNYKTIVVGNYHPLTIVSYVIEYQLAGLNPFVYHFDNLLLHLFNIVLFSWLVWLLTKTTYATLIATALFAVHPMRVESVVWAAERKDVLYSFFFLLSLIFYIYFLLKERRNYQFYFISIIFFILSILSKGQAVVLPLTLFLLDYWYSRKITITSILHKIPYLILALVSGILAIIAQQSSLTEQRIMAHSFADRIGIAAFNISAYIYKLVYPFNLSCFYKYPAPDHMTWVYAGALLAIILSIFTLVWFRKDKLVIFGSLFFLFTISIVSQILPVGNAIIADRYTYIPYLGLFIITGVLFDKIITGKRKNAQYFLVFPMILFIIFSFKTYAQSMTWHNNKTLWENAIRQDPDNGLAYNSLGKYYLDHEDYPAAITQFEKAIQKKATYPEYFGAYQNLGATLSRIGKNEEAIKNFSIALSLRPAFIDALFNRGLSYSSIGKYDSAIADFSRILSTMDSLHVKSYYSRGIAFNRMNQPDRAIADYSSAIRLDPNYREPYVNRGNIFFHQNLLDAAISDYNTALRINPNDGSTHLNRSFVFFQVKRYKEALEDAQKAKEMNINVDKEYLTDLQHLVNPSSNL